MIFNTMYCNCTISSERIYQIFGVNMTKYLLNLKCTELKVIIHCEARNVFANILKHTYINFNIYLIVSLQFH